MKMMKKCPGCGTWHEPNAMSCTLCFTDLLGVRAENVDELSSPEDSNQSRNQGQSEGRNQLNNQAQSAGAYSSNTQAQSAGANSSNTQAQSEEQNFANQILVRCPDCGKLNSYSLSMCDCGAPLAGLMPIMPGEPVISDTGNNPHSNGRTTGSTTSSSVGGTFDSMAGSVFDSTTGDSMNFSPSVQNRKTSFVLQSDDGQYKIELGNNQEFYFGREATGADYLYNKSFVSRRHVKLGVINGEPVITHVSTSNPTLVNGKALIPNSPFRLQSGDTIVMGARENQGYLPNAAYFTIR